MQSDGHVRAQVVASGRVQGVFYRDTIRRAAVEHSVSGSAVNLPDGTVECFFEGPKEAVDQLIDVAREGSRISRVEMVEINWLEPTGSSGFTTG